MNKAEQELRRKSPVQIRNKKASFEYNFVDTYTAGIVLTGTEIKSIRMGKASLVDIALARGKKEYDKRQTLKEKEDRREMDRAIKNF